MDCVTVEMLAGVREARIRWRGDWEARAWASPEPMEDGEMPVIITVEWEVSL